MVAVEGLVLTVCHKQRLLQRSQQVHFLDIGTRIMDEYAGLHISVGVNMAVVSAACDTAAHIFTIVLEVKSEDGLPALSTLCFTSAILIYLSFVFLLYISLFLAVIAEQHIDPCQQEDDRTTDQHTASPVTSDPVSCIDTGNHG